MKDNLDYNNKGVLRVAAIHDLSCFGRCALAIVIPILSSMGVQVCPLPTALLSSHLDGYKQVAWHDLSDEMPEIYRRWQAEGVTFDAIYSGFLADGRQTAIVRDFIKIFANDETLVLIDPVLGDDGKYYSAFDWRMGKKMRELVPLADIITPNFTEACLLLGEEYCHKSASNELIKEYLRRLSAMGPKKVVMTGVPVEQGGLLNAAFDSDSDSFNFLSSEFVDCRYPGTGDTYASVLLGAILQGKAWQQALHLAGDFVLQAVKLTWQARTPRREGVLLEKMLPRLHA